MDEFQKPAASEFLHPFQCLGAISQDPQLSANRRVNLLTEQQRWFRGPLGSDVYAYES